MTKKFKVGDTVRCKIGEGRSFLRDGLTYVVDVAYTKASDDYVKVGNVDEAFWAERFELVKPVEPMFKVGDRVRCIDDTATATGSDLRKNRIYTVESVNIGRQPSSDLLTLVEVTGGYGFRLERFVPFAQAVSPDPAKLEAALLLLAEGYPNCLMDARNALKTGQKAHVPGEKICGVQGITGAFMTAIEAGYLKPEPVKVTKSYVMWAGADAFDAKGDLLVPVSQP